MGDSRLGQDSFVTFTINGRVYHVGPELDPNTFLITFIREFANLKGTKYMCREGGCGSCVVSITYRHPVTKQDETFAINSCLIPVFACHGAAITTVEGIGNKTVGYHAIQSTLAAFNGTQCGYCSPGFVMNMFSLLVSKPKLTMQEIENSFSGNICRCTGYRPILDAFKSLAIDAPPHLKNEISDIEDLKGCSINGASCKDACSSCPRRNEANTPKDEEGDESYESSFVELALAPTSPRIGLLGRENWFRVTDIPQIFQLFDYIGNNSYILVAGYTAHGVYKPKVWPNIYIDINDVPALRGYTVLGDRIVLGGNITLAELIQIFHWISSQNQLLFGYTRGLAEHIELVANVPVRNRATIAGNLMIKHAHREFPSDIFLIMETCGAQITIRDSSGIENTMSLLEFLETDMFKKVIISLSVPALSSNHYIYRSYKIMPRRQNVRALINAGFLFRINKSNRCMVEEQPNILFGAINPNFTHAFKTEAFLTGKSLCDQRVLSSALRTLASELQTAPDPEFSSPEYRSRVAPALFYRFVLSVNTLNVSQQNRSGAENLKRPLSSGQQKYEINTKEKPVHLPIRKLEALIQCSGEAEYIEDMPPRPGQLYGALVISDRARAKIASINAAPALNMPGVAAFFSARDIPGKNNFIVPNFVEFAEEEIFSTGNVLYAGQPIGIIVAKNQELAIKAAGAVIINYTEKTKPLLTIQEAMRSGDQSRIRLEGSEEPTETKDNIVFKLSGEVELGFQYHFTMELHTCNVVPVEDGLDVYSSTQWMNHVQSAISTALDIPLNSINMEVRRLGGAYGAKVSRSSLVGAACALAAYKLQRPVRIMLDLRTNMKAIGKRAAVLTQYEAGVDENGKIQYLNINTYENIGCSGNGIAAILVIGGTKNIYDFATWKINIYSVLTDLSTAGWTRAPGNVEGTSIIEWIMDHIAHVTKKDPVDVRTVNLSTTDRSDAEDAIRQVKASSNYEWRMVDVERHNNENRWKKRGIYLVPTKFDVLFFIPNYYSMVSIYSNDGTVAVLTGGIEMGQGVNTKVAQVCAYILGVDLSMIKLKPCLNHTAPNSASSWGSITSDTVPYATSKCCEKLNDRLQPIKDKMPNATWQEIVKQAELDGVNLNATYMYSLKDPIPKDYPVFGCTVLEVELDVLTGQSQILRADIFEDAGESLNPAIDIGQIEGAFVMGLGYMGSERLVFHPDSGQLLTNRTWNYWPPMALDIPIDFRVSLKKNSKNPRGYLGSKATGEPPICMAVVYALALRQAVRSARRDAGLPDEWFTFNPPCTFEKAFLAGGTSPEEFFL